MSTTSKRERKYAITFSQPTLTQQHSKDETDINKIMARYIKTGVIDHVAKYEPQYRDNDDLDYHQSQNIILKADAMFSELPSSVRKEFQNNPSEFLKAVNSPDATERLVELGLAKPQPEVKKPTLVEKPSTKPKNPPEEPAPAA